MARRQVAAGFVVSIILAAPSHVHAMDCADAMTQQAINACIAAEFEAADTDLNAAYRSARAFMHSRDAAHSAKSTEAEVALRDAQRAWISYRDQACFAESFLMKGGSAEAMVVLGCKARLTQQRAQDLWTLAAGPEG